MALDDYTFQPDDDWVEETPQHKRKLRGRGALGNPTGRFESVEVVYDPDDEWQLPEEPDRIPTQYYRDHSKSVVTTNDSPDVGFDASLNPYRGCEHGCIYCYARPTHEYFGLSGGIDFETKILVKTDAPQLLRKKLSSRSWQPQPIILSGVTDPYQPAERRFQLTRQCLEVLAEFRNPVAIITKNHLVTRDIDVLSELARFNAVRVNLSVTTLDSRLARIMEPRTADPPLRLRAIRELNQAGVPVSVMMGPIIPGLTDHEIPAVLKAAAEAGAQGANYTILRLPWGNKELFESWLEEHFPNRKDKILNRQRHMRNGKLYDPKFGSRMRGEGEYADQIADIFKKLKKRHGLDKPTPPLSTEHFRKHPEQQLSLF